MSSGHQNKKYNNSARSTENKEKGAPPQYEPVTTKNGSRATEKKNPQASPSSYRTPFLRPPYESSILSSSASTLFVKRLHILCARLFEKTANTSPFLSLWIPAPVNEGKDATQSEKKLRKRKQNVKKKRSSLACERTNELQNYSRRLNNEFYRFNAGNSPFPATRKSGASTAARESDNV